MKTRLALISLFVLLAVLLPGVVPAQAGPIEIRFSVTNTTVTYETHWTPGSDFHVSAFFDLNAPTSQGVGTTYGEQATLWES